MRHIDAHGHIIVEEITADHGPEPWRPRLERTPEGVYSTNVQVRNGPMPHEGSDVPGMLAAMDKLRIDMMLICPPPFLFLYDLPGAEGLNAARIQNDAMAAVARQHPDRFAPLAMIPMQDTQLALAELRRATHELGFHGVEIGSNVRGVHLGDPEFRPFWQACAADDLFVFIHPEYFQGHSSPTLKQYYLTNLVGNPSETGLNAAHMIFSGLFTELPDLKVMLGHAGGTMPWIMGRWEHGWEKRPEPQRDLKTSPMAAARHFYVDTIAHGDPQLRVLVELFGADHVLLGSDFPFDMGQDDPVGEIEGLSGLSESDRAAILGGNITRLAHLG